MMEQEGKSMETQTKLLPCPMCGKLPELTKHFKEDNWGLVHRCKAWGPIVFAHAEIARNIERWNTRTPDAAKDAAIAAYKSAVHADVKEFRRDSATLEAQAEQIATMKKALEGAEIMIGYLLEWAQTNREFRANDAESKNAKITLSSVGAALASTAPVAEAGQKEGEK